MRYGEQLGLPVVAACLIDMCDGVNSAASIARGAPGVALRHARSTA